MQNVYTYIYIYIFPTRLRNTEFQSPPNLVREDIPFLNRIPSFLVGKYRERENSRNEDGIGVLVDIGDCRGITRSIPRVWAHTHAISRPVRAVLIVTTRKANNYYNCPV